MIDIKEILTATVVLFAVIDIIGNIPVIISLRKKVGHIQSGKASIIAGIIMIVFLFIGEEILKLIGIDINSFAVAGSIIIFFLSLEMILGISLYKDEEPETASVVPLAFPLIAGAGTMTSLLSLRAEYHVVNIIFAIIVNIIIVFMILKSSSFLERLFLFIILLNSSQSLSKKFLFFSKQFLACFAKFITFSTDLFLDFLDNKLTEAWQYIQDSHTYLKFVILSFSTIK